MSITFSCPSCFATVKAPDGRAGHSARCPGCLGRVVVPGPPLPTSLDESGLPTTLHRRPSQPQTELYDQSGQQLQAGICCPLCGRNVAAGERCPWCARRAAAAVEVEPIEEPEEVEEPAQVWPIRERTMPRWVWWGGGGLVGLVLICLIATLATGDKAPAAEDGRSGDIQVVARRAYFGTVRTHSSVDGWGWYDINNRYLFVVIDVINWGQDPCEFHGWHEEGRSRVRLLGPGGKSWRMIDLSDGTSPQFNDRDKAGIIQEFNSPLRSVIRPGTTATVAVVLDCLALPSGDFALLLPKANVGGRGQFRLTLPARSSER